MEDPIARWHIFFSGDVQGVGFRFTARHFAQNLGLTGWVRNLHDERVEMEVQGPVSRIRTLLNQLQSTPPIHIENTEIEKITVNPKDKRFSIALSW